LRKAQHAFLKKSWTGPTTILQQSCQQQTEGQRRPKKKQEAGGKKTKKKGKKSNGWTSDDIWAACRSKESMCWLTDAENGTGKKV